MLNIHGRDPRGLRKVRRERAGLTGLVVHAWYNPVPGWSSEHGWNAVGVAVDGTERVRLYQVNPGPQWLDLVPGAHFIEFRGTVDALHAEWIEVQPGEAVLIAFKPRERVPFRKRPTAEQWSTRRLW
jgi:hypothetical protein